MASARPWALAVCLCVSGTCSCGSCSGAPQQGSPRRPRGRAGSPAGPRGTQFPGVSVPPGVGSVDCQLPRVPCAPCGWLGAGAQTPRLGWPLSPQDKSPSETERGLCALVPRSAPSQEPRVPCSGRQVASFLGVPAQRVGGCRRRALGQPGKGCVRPQGCSGPSAFMALTHQVGPPPLGPGWPRGAGSGWCPASGAGIFLGTWGTEGGRPGSGPGPMRALVRRGAGKVGSFAGSDPCLPCRGSPGIRVCLWLGLLGGRTGHGAAWDGSGCLGVLGHSAWKLWSGRGGPPSLPCGSQ